jgi:hypothetical protein
MLSAFRGHLKVLIRASGAPMRFRKMTRQSFLIDIPMPGASFVGVDNYKAGLMGGRLTGAYQGHLRRRTRHVRRNQDLRPVRPCHLPTRCQTPPRRLRTGGPQSGRADPGYERRSTKPCLLRILVAFSIAWNFNYPPEHGSWWNRAGIEIAILERNALSRRLASEAELHHQG